MPGGLYDQHPDILDRFLYILGKQNEERKRQEEADERKANKGQSKIRRR